jgi:hypothetical protein
VLMDAYDAVHALGSTPDEVAATLEAAGARGVRHNAHECPVSRYLLDACGALKVMTTLALAEVYYSTGLGYLSVDRVKLPRPVYEAIIAFDSGDYPQLEDNEEVWL